MATLKLKAIPANQPLCDVFLVLKNPTHSWVGASDGKLVMRTNELTDLMKRECVHRYEIDDLLKNISEAYYAFDDFAITKFEVDYPRCRQCKEIIVFSSKRLKYTCSKCDCLVFKQIIEKCGIPTLEDILSDANIDFTLNVDDIVQLVLQNEVVCEALVDRHWLRHRGKE